MKNETILFGLVDQFDSLVSSVSFKMIWVVNPNDPPLFLWVLWVLSGLAACLA